MMTTLTRISALLLALAGCAAPEPTITAASAPELGKADGTDAADRSCQVILRSVDRRSGGPDGVDAQGYLIWEGTVDVAVDALDAGAEVAVLYHRHGRDWYEVSATPSGDPAPSGFVRFDFEFSYGVFLGGNGGTVYSEMRIDVLPFLRTPNGGRLFDHNVVEDDLGLYTLSYPFRLTTDPAVCGATGVVEEQHRADYSCEIVLRDVGRKPGSPVATVDGWAVWEGQIDVSRDALAAGAEVSVLYRRDDRDWQAVSATEIEGEGTERYARFGFEMWEGISQGGEGSVSFQQMVIELIPALRFPDGTTLYDHNRVSDPLASYELYYGWDALRRPFELDDDPAVCEGR